MTIMGPSGPHIATTEKFAQYETNILGYSPCFQNMLCKSIIYAGGLVIDTALLRETMEMKQLDGTRQDVKDIFVGDA
jgi:hypothetical protein